MCCPNRGTKFLRYQSILGELDDKTAAQNLKELDLVRKTLFAEGWPH